MLFPRDAWWTALFQASPARLDAWTPAAMSPRRPSGRARRKPPWSTRTSMRAGHGRRVPSSSTTRTSSPSTGSGTGIHRTWWNRPPRRPTGSRQRCGTARSRSAAGSSPGWTWLPSGTRVRAAGARGRGGAPVDGVVMPWTGAAGKVPRDACCRVGAGCHAVCAGGATAMFWPATMRQPSVCSAIT